MIDPYFTCRSSGHSICHIVDTLQCIEIEATDDICFGDQFICKVFVTVIQQDILTARHPPQKIGKSIRHNYVYCFLL